MNILEEVRMQLGAVAFDVLRDGASPMLGGWMDEQLAKGVGMNVPEPVVKSMIWEGLKSVADSVAADGQQGGSD